MLIRIAHLDKIIHNVSQMMCSWGAFAICHSLPHSCNLYHTHLNGGFLSSSHFFLVTMFFFFYALHHTPNVSYHFISHLNGDFFFSYQFFIFIFFPFFKIQNFLLLFFQLIYFSFFLPSPIHLVCLMTSFPT